MKKITSALLLLTVIFVSACKKDKTEESVSANVSFKVNGTFKQASGNTKVTAFNYSSEKTLQIIGSLDNNQAISLLIQDYNGVGEYDIADNNVIASYTTDINGGLNGSLIGTTGSIKVTSVTNNVVKGTFQFVVLDYDTDLVISTITEGQFEAKLMSM